MATIHDLPPELLADIFSYVSIVDGDDTSLYWHKWSLRSVTMVCRLWGRLGQIEGHNSFAVSGSRIISYAASKRPEKYRTKRLKIIMGSWLWSGCGPLVDGDTIRTSICSLFVRIKGLEELSFSHCYQDWVLLTSPSLSGLKALSTQTEGNDQEQDTLATIPLHFPFKLSSLTIKLNGRCIPSFAFMKACFTALNRHPTSLRITTECGDNAFDFLVPHFSLIADTLHTLSIDLNCNESVGADRTLTNSVLPTLIGLQTLIVDMNSYGSLGRRAMDDDDYAIGEALVELGDFLPPNLRVIKIIKIVYGHFEAVKEFVEGSLPASVQHVFAILDSERMKGDYSEKTRDLAGEAAAKLAFEELGVVFLEDL